MSTQPNTTEPTTPPADSWPEIDCLTADAAVDLAVNPTWYSAGKVLFDYVTALLLLPLALPLIALSALAVKLTSPGRVFYTQTRLGLNGRRYPIVKIRTMYQDCEAKTGIKWSTKGDDRITPVGKVLRKTHLDELPQLFNVLLGHMSLVGPRPERPEVIKAKGLEQLVPGYAHRLLVKPGVTGIAQVQLPADSDVASVRRKVVYDLYYVENQGLLLDLRLIVATLAKAAGASPKMIRRLFLLPGRRTIATTFHNRVVTAPAESALVL
ncbi:MAG: sugar transferase, partial [Gemmataceae bacterium]|nr:sugar transferase [Gemmataceae bacterium]